MLTKLGHGHAKQRQLHCHYGNKHVNDQVGAIVESNVQSSSQKEKHSVYAAPVSLDAVDSHSKPPWPPNPSYLVSKVRRFLLMGGVCFRVEFDWLEVALFDLCICSLMLITVLL